MVSLRGIGSTCVTYSQPFTPAIGLFALASGWYARQLTYTYGPSLLVQWCIRSTIKSVNNVALGTFLGTTVVAPVVVPQMVPPLAFAVTMGTGYVSIVCCNLLARFIFGLNKPTVFALNPTLAPNHLEGDSKK